MNYMILAVSWTVFYFLHSFLASSKLKRILKEKLPWGYKWYRLFYTTVSAVLFLGIVFQSILIEPERLWQESTLTVYLGYMLATFGTILAVKSSKAWSWKKFFGLCPESVENESLVKSGLYGKMRHPLYGALIILFLGYVVVAGTLTALVHLLCLLIYLPFGIYFEEKNLIEKFGKSYQIYQKEVPPLIPKWSK